MSDQLRNDAVRLAARLLGLDTEALDAGDRMRCEHVAQRALVDAARGPYDAYDVLDGDDDAHRARVFRAVARAVRLYTDS